MTSPQNQHRVGRSIYRWLAGLYRKLGGPDAPRRRLHLAWLRFSHGERATVRVDGHTFEVDLRDTGVGYDLFVQGRYEPAETAIIKQIVRPGDNVIDVGANIGYYTVLFGHLVGQAGRVLAIEPDPETAELLRSNIRSNGLASRIEVIQAAAGSGHRLVKLHRSSIGNRGDFRVRSAQDPTLPANRFDDTVDVSEVPIDDLVPTWDHADFVKVDVQGYERRVLTGLAETLRRSPKITILTEFWPTGITDAGDSAIDFLNDLILQKFDLFEPTIEGKLKSVTVDSVLRDLADSVPAYTNLICSRHLKTEGKLPATELASPGI